ncbi:AAA family ATPase [Pseudanabaena sp. UWO310]|uniref:AAA family ATPase n=1 Tax=Pseudanabaena sp. UWO310 TaxID=2480795 RepID=UPI00115835F1|nr:AAA family ATPase [Pseudanabaena sp. UWO310]TYQ31175.1 AAA family ATPase [Pseudanabaena sp. UWO310]
MKINNFNFRNNSQNWHLEKTYFDNLNLLVGASGVGKTRILKALYLICNVAQGEVQMLEDVEWSIDFYHLGQKYRWELKALSPNEKTFSSEQNQSEIVDEKLIKYAEDNESIEILHRTKIESTLNQNQIPKLKRTESAINLLSEEDSITPISEAFKRFIFNETPQSVIVSIPFDPSNAPLSLDSKLEGSDSSLYLQKFKVASGNTTTVLKAYFLQRFFPHIFNEIKYTYIEIFPSVQDIKITINREPNNRYSLLFEIKETFSETWITQLRISSGMYRTLTYLIEVIAAPEESIIMIDEFENSLGINCMPQLTDFILDKSPNLQFILTSHHPYIINNIPWKTWQLVSRSNGTIRTRKAVDIPELNTASSLDKFTQLINLLEHEEETA